MPFDLQPIDVLLLVLLALAALSGWRRGFAMVLLGYLGLLVGLALGAWAATQAGLLVSADSSVRRLLTAVVVFFLVAAACHAVGNLLGIRVRSLLGGRWTSRADAIGGAVVATVVAAVAMWFVALTLSNVPLSPFTRAVHSSSVLRTIDNYAPRPPAALAQLRGLLDRSGFPEAFATLRPPVVSGPPPEAARNPAVLRAANATLQIQSRGCGGVLFGSGFPIATDLVITNAHVVAGSRRHEVVTNEGVRASASVVYFDPAHDLALLSVPDLPVGPLRLAGAAARRGQEAVVIGYPSGGAQKAIGARIVLRTQPEAPDIYARPQDSRRDIYVLHARVRKGVSGGPVVDLRGRPLGVVFAASTVERSEGYALTNAEVRRAVSRSNGNRRPVSVGGCAV
ncbi:MAG TPA: MarP family serine protease [Actinomycetota bacterium]|jgi:S1-C subfamily serine protease|nr:MarP family serine protease [Actinomycetota bacterium]